MFERKWMVISKKISARRTARLKRRIMPTDCLKDTADRADEFLEAARDLIRRSRLDISYVAGAYRANMTVLHNGESYRLGCIIENDFLVDCSLIHKVARNLPYCSTARQAQFFKELFQIGVLHRCRYIKRSLWYELHPPWATPIIPGHTARYYCISNDILRIGLADFSEVHSSYDGHDEYDDGEDNEY